MNREIMERALVALEAMQMEARARSCGLKICDDSIEELRSALRGLEPGETDAAPAGMVQTNECTRTAPKRIWLQVGADSYDCNAPFPADVDGITWCAEPVLDCEVEYVRADLAAAEGKR